MTIDRMLKLTAMDEAVRDQDKSVALMILSQMIERGDCTLTFNRDSDKGLRDVEDLKKLGIEV